MTIIFEYRGRPIPREEAVQHWQGAIRAHRRLRGRACLLGIGSDGRSAVVWVRGGKSLRDPEVAQRGTCG